MKKDYVVEKIGTAIVSDVSIEGEERKEIQFTNSKSIKQINMNLLQTAGSAYFNSINIATFK